MLLIVAAWCFEIAQRWHAGLAELSAQVLNGLGLLLLALPCKYTGRLSARDTIHAGCQLTRRAMSGSLTSSAATSCCLTAATALAAAVTT